MTLQSLFLCFALLCSALLCYAPRAVYLKFPHTFAGVSMLCFELCSAFSCFALLCSSLFSSALLGSALSCLMWSADFARLCSALLGVATCYALLFFKGNRTLFWYIACFALLCSCHERAAAVAPRISLITSVSGTWTWKKGNRTKNNLCFFVREN